MDKLVWVAFAFLAGALLPVQGAFNTRLGVAAQSPMHATLISFVVGTCALAAYVLVTRTAVSWDGVMTAPWYAWLGGFCGAVALTGIVMAYPRLGPGLTFGLIVAGQLVISVLLEHFDILVAEPHPISVLRVLGVMMVLGGVVMIRAF